MTREEADRIIAVVRKDANTTGVLFSHGDRACVIGGLYEAAFDSRKPGYDEDPYTRVQREYYLTNRQSGQLISMNDQHARTAARRKALITLVESWVTA